MSTDGTPDPRRQELPHDAGLHSRELDLALTRDELAKTLDDLFAKFNLRLIVTSRPVLFAAVFLVGSVASAVAISSLARKRRRRG